MAFVDLQEVAHKELIPGYKVQFVHSENMTFAHWAIVEGSPLPEHSHPHEQVATVIEGKFQVTVDGLTRVLGPNTMAIIPSNARHSGKAITNCRLIDVFYPVREDYKE